MAGLFGSSNAGTVTKYTGINIQTSSLGLCIPVGWGLNRAGTNLIWYNDFIANPSDKGGKGGSSKSGSYTYTAAVILALGEGPVGGINTVWVDQSVSTLGSLNLGLWDGGGSQTPPSFITDNYPAQALGYSYTAFLFSSLYSLGSSAALPAHNFEVKWPLYNSMYSVAGVPDANMADIVNDLITNTQYGLDAGVTYVDPVSLQYFHDYTQAQGLFYSPYVNQQEQGISILQRYAQISNTWIFWSGTQLKFVPLGDAVLESNGVTFTPKINPLFSIGPDDYQNKQGEDPVTVNISDPRDGFNRVEIHVKERSQQYVDYPIYWEDQTSVDLYGALQSQIISASEICSRVIGATAASLIGQRSVYIRNTYTFKLDDGIAAILEPGDLLALNEPNIGLTEFPVRVQTLTENIDQVITVVAEEFPYGIGQTVLYNPQESTGTGIPDINTPPGNVNPPMFYEPTLSETGGVGQLWIGASGGPDWGGANVYASSDGTNYAFIGSIEGATTQGTLTAALASHVDPDTIDTLAINTSICYGTLSTAVTSAMADLFQTPALVDQEVICYGTVTLTGSYAWSLTYLRRGTYNTAPAAHSSGAPFAQINPAVVVKYAIPKQLIGLELYFKFCSFNSRQGGLQDISDVTAITYTPVGYAYEVAAPTGLVASLPGAGSSAILNWTPDPNEAILQIQIFRATGLSQPFTATTLVATIPAPASSYQDNSTNASTAYTYYIKAVSAVFTSSASNGSSVTTKSAGYTLLPLVNGSTPVGIITGSSGVPVYVLQ